MSSKSSASSSPTSSKDSSPGKVEFFVGNRIEAMDYLCNWYVSKIAKVDHKKKKILIHFEGWNQRYDEWVSFDSKKIRALPKEKIISKRKPKEFKEWKEGDLVSAKWSDGTFYPAEIVKVISKDFYEVEYDDGFQKIIHQSKIREYDATNKLKKPSSLGRSSQPGRKAKLAEDRASRAKRRSVKDRSLLSPQSSEATEHTEKKKEMKVEQKEEKIEKKEVKDIVAELKSEDTPESPRKPPRHDSDASQESKPHKTEGLAIESDEKSADLQSTSPPTDEANQSIPKTETAIPFISPAPQPSESKPCETIEPQNETIPKTSPKIPEKLTISLPDDVPATENTIRVTHIKENVEIVSPNTESVKRSITSPLSVEVDPRTDIRQVIIPDKDMNILQSTGVLGLLNVQEPCVILGTTLAGSTTTTSAAEEVLSKCNIPARVPTEIKTSEKKGEHDKMDEDKILEEIYILEKAELSKKKLNDLKAKMKSAGASLDSRSSVGTSNETQKAEVDESSGFKQDIEGDIGKDKDMTCVEKSNPDQVIPKQVEEIRLEKDKSLETKAEQVITSVEREDISSLKALDEIEDVTGHAQKSEDVTEHAQKSEEATEHAQKSEEATKSKPQALGVDSFKAKRLRLDQITGKLSIQRQTQITAKREVIKQKLDHLKTEEITKSTHAPPSYQQRPPNPPPYPHVSAPTSRITPQYVERYPAPTLLTYGAPTQCTGPCCTYPPGSSYTSASTAGYHISPGGLPRETYVVYGPGTQASFPVIAPTISPAPCSCCSLYPTAVLHEAGQTGPPLVRLMQVDQRSLPASLVYTHTASHPGDRPMISPRGLSPRGISPKGISPEGRKPGRAHMSKKAEQESGTKHKDSGKQDKASIEGKQVIRSEESSRKKLMQPASKLSPDAKSGQYKPSDKTSYDGVKPSQTHIHPHTSHSHPPTSTTVNPKSSLGTPTNPSTIPNAPDVNLSKHLSAHLTSPDTPQGTTPTKRPPPSHLALDPDDIPLSRLVSASTPGETTPGDAKTLGAITPEVITPVTPNGDSPLEQLMSTPLPADGHPGKMLRRPHVFAPKELRIELDHNKYKCEHPDCDKSFRKASLLESHVKYYHASPPDNKRKRSSASGSEEDWYESNYPKKRTKRQSTSDVSIGSVGDISVDAQSPTASDIHVEVEHDLDDEMDVDMSEHKEEDVVRCLCGVREDSGLMIQCEQCYTWQHSDCVHVGQDPVPTKYFCYVCRNPPGLRKNARYKNNYDWFKTGVLPSFVPREEHEVKIVQAQVTHCLLSDLHTLNSGLKGLKRKVHILRTPNHADLKMWEHKHEVCEDDSLTTTEGESSRNDSSVSEKETGINEETFTEGQMQENVLHGQSENAPRDNTRVGDHTRGTREICGNDVTESNTRGEDHTRESRETRGNDVTDARNGKSEEGKDESETKRTVSNEGMTENREVGNSQRLGQVREASNELPHEGRDNLNNGDVEDNKEIETSEHLDVKETSRFSDNQTHSGQETARMNDIQARDGKESARMNDLQARSGPATARMNDIQARGEKESARMNDIQARGVEQTRDAQETPRSVNDTMERLDNNQEVRSSYDLGERETGAGSGRFDEAKMKYSGEDLAFVNLLEEIEEDQTLFDEQLDKLEKQVEILEKSLLIGGTTERRPSIRKLAKQLSKLQKLGFVC